MKVELIYDGEGNLMIIKDGEVTHHYCDYSISKPAQAIIDTVMKEIPEYKE